MRLGFLTVLLLAIIAQAAFGHEPNKRDFKTDLTRIQKMNRSDLSAVLQWYRQDERYCQDTLNAEIYWAGQAGRWSKRILQLPKGSERSQAVINRKSCQSLSDMYTQVRMKVSCGVILKGFEKKK